MYALHTREDSPTRWFIWNTLPLNWIFFWEYVGNIKELTCVINAHSKLYSLIFAASTENGHYLLTFIE